jgi:O-antigen/teichoic acid export membrane protein
MTSRKFNMFRDAVLYAGANYIAQGIGIFNSFLLRGFLGPAAIGMWSVIQVILGYCGYASLGTTRALGRDYPILRGKGDFEQAEHTKDSTLTFSMLVSVVPAVGLLVWALWKRNSLEAPFLIGIYFLVIFLFVQRFYDFIVTLLRSEKEFKVLSIQIVLNAIGGVAITVMLVQPWKIYGLYAGTALLTALLIAYLHFAHPYRFKIELHKATLLHELKLGLPLIASAFLYTFLIGLDKLIVAKKLGFFEVGLYSIAMMVSNYVLSLPMMMSHIVYPNLLEAYGEKNEDRTQVIGYLEKPIFLLAVLVPFLCAMAFAGVPLLVDLFLRKFIPGLGCMRIYLAGTFFLLVGQFANNYLVAIDRYLKVIPILLITIGLNFLFCLLFIQKGWGIEGVALGTVLSYAFYGIVTYLLAFWEAHGSLKALSAAMKDIVMFIVFFASIFILDGWICAKSPWMTALVKACAFLTVSVPFLYLAEKRERLIEVLLNSFKKKNMTKEQGS